MLQTKTIVAVGALAIMGGAFAYTATRKDPHVKKASTGAIGNTAAPASIVAKDVDEVAITDVGKPKLVLKKGADGAWKLSEPVADTADQKNVEAALGTLEKMKFKEMVSESKDSWTKLQIEDAQVLTVALSGGGKPIATVHIGKTGNVRLNDDPRVWIVTDLNRFALARETKMWRDRTLLRFEKDQLDRFEIVTDAGVKIVAHREPGKPPAPAPGDDPKKPKPTPQDTWTIALGQQAIGGALDESVPGNLSLILPRLDASDFADGATDESAGLAKPRVTLTAVLKDGTKKDLSIGKEDAQEVYVKTSASPRIYKVRTTSVDNALKPPLQWRDKTLSKLDPRDVEKLSIQKGEAKGVFQRVDDKTWKTLEPADLGELDSIKVSGLAAGFANLRAAMIADAPDAKKTGLDKPTEIVSVWKKDGTQVTLTFGAEVDKAYYVKVTDRPEIFQLAETAAIRFLKAPADLKKSATPPAGADPHAGMGMPPGMPPQHP